MLKTVVTAVALGTSLLAAQSTEAQQFTVSCTNTSFVFPPVNCLAARGPQNSIIYYIPATGENEPGSEPDLNIRFPGFAYDTYSINGGPRLSRNPEPFPEAIHSYNVLEGPNVPTVSDIVLIVPNTFAPMGADDRIIITSDPPPPTATPSTNLGTLAVEGEQGETVTMELFFGDSRLQLDFGFDGEFVFDPFGVGFDTSDQVRVSGFPPEDFVLLSFLGGETPGRVPEPSSLFLLCSGLTGVAALAMRQHRRKAAHSPRVI